MQNIMPEPTHGPPRMLKQAREATDSEVTNEPKPRQAMPSLLATIQATASAADRFAERGAIGDRKRSTSGCGCKQPREPRIAAREVTRPSAVYRAPVLDVELARPAHDAPIATPVAPTLDWNDIQALLWPEPVQSAHEVIARPEAMRVLTVQPYAGIPLLNPDILFQTGLPSLPAQYNKCNLARDYETKLRAMKALAERALDRMFDQDFAAEVDAARNALADAHALLKAACGGEPIEFALFLCDDPAASPHYDAARKAFNTECWPDMVKFRTGANELRDFLSKELFGGKPAPLVPAAGSGSDWYLWIGDDVNDPELLRRAIHLCNLLWDREGENSAITSLADLKKALQRMLVAAGCYDQPDSAKNAADDWAEIDGIWLERSRAAWNCWLGYDFDIKNKARRHLGAHTWTPLVPLLRPEPEGPFTPFDADEAKRNRPPTTPQHPPADGPETPHEDWTPGFHYDCDEHLLARRRMMVEYLRRAIAAWENAQDIGGPGTTNCPKKCPFPLPPQLRPYLLTILIAKACRESPWKACKFDNSGKGHTGRGGADGIMQVTPASGCRSLGDGEKYTNTPESIEMNMRDGVRTLCEAMRYVRRTLRPLEDYSGAQIAAKLMSHYNGGADPVSTYRRGQGDPKYLANVAEQIKKGCLDDFDIPADEALTEDLLDDLLAEMEKLQSEVDDELGR